MKALRFLLAIPLLAGSTWAATQAVNDLVLPERIFPQLETILKTAVAQSPRMVNRALDLEIAENSRIQSRANLLPNLGGYYSHYEARDDRADLVGRQDVTKVAYNVSLTQPLFHWGERRNNARMGEIQQVITRGQYRDGYRMLAQELRTAYLYLIVQKLSVKRTRFYAELTSNLLRQQEERLAKKVISEAEIALARLTAEQAQIAFERAEFDLHNSKASFARLTGLGVLADDAIPDMLPQTKYAAQPYAQLLAGFLAQKDPLTTEAATLRHQLEVEKLNYANLRTRLLPKFNAVLGTSQDEQSYSLNVAQKFRVNSIYGGISVNWAIFDGFSSPASVRTSLARRHQMENDYRQLTERLAQSAQIQVRQVNFSARNMSIYDRFLSNAEGTLKSVQEDFARGVKSEADVGQAQLGLYDAQINASNTRIDYLLKTGDFLGTIMEDPVVANLSVK